MPNTLFFPAGTVSCPCPETSCTFPCCTGREIAVELNTMKDDGDGGIRGFADSSEMLNFTMNLLRRRYSEDDIARIWGGNWLRVMAEVQKNREWR